MTSRSKLKRHSLQMWLHLSSLRRPVQGSSSFPHVYNFSIDFFFQIPGHSLPTRFRFTVSYFPPPTSKACISSNNTDLRFSTVYFQAWRSVDRREDADVEIGFHRFFFFCLNLDNDAAAAQSAAASHGTVWSQFPGENDSAMHKNLQTLPKAFKNYRKNK